MKTKADYRTIRKEWRKELARDVFREASRDEERLGELAIRKEREDLRAMKEASRLYKKGG